MTFDEFLDLLDRLVADGELTLAEAEILALQYDDLDLDEVLAPEQLRGWGDDLDPITWAIIAATLFSILKKVTGRANVTQTVAALSYGQKNAVFGAVQQSWQQSTAALSADLANGVLTPAQWQIQMNESLLSHFRSAAYLGYGTTTLTPAQQAAFDAAVRVQQAYLSRFADNYQLSVLRGTPWSVQYIANRANMYSGAMRAFAFRSVEGTTGPGSGWVYLYIAVDDERTCSPCIEAMRNGPYLAGEGPYPGEVCEGRHRCRCQRTPIYDPDAYGRLTA
jgi:hypothetical protein